MARILLALWRVHHRSARLQIVDDNVAIRFAPSEYFRGNGWAVDAAADKDDAEPSSPPRSTRPSWRTSRLVRFEAIVDSLFPEES
jgi:hypothetical protein